MEVSIWHVVLVFMLSVTIDIIWFIRTISGTLRIDRSNPEKDVYRFDVDDLNKLPKKKFILLAVDKNADLSQK